MPKRKPKGITALTITQAARLLRITKKQLEADIDNGAPLNEDGTLNLIQYVAWLNKVTDGRKA